MIIINAITLLILFIFYILSLKTPKEWLKDVDKKEHKLYFLYPMAELLFRKTRLDKLLWTKTKVADSIKALYVTNKPAEIQRLYWCNKVATIISIIFVFSILSMLGQLGGYSDGPLEEGKYLVRPEHGEGSREIELDVTLEDASGKADNITASRSLTINVAEQQYEAAELTKRFDEATEYLKENVLGENSSAESIDQQLNFCNAIPGTGISVEWKPEDYTLIKADGTVCNENLKESTSTSVIAVLHYFDKTTEIRFLFQLMPKNYSLDEVINKELVEEIQASSERTSKEDYLELPSTIRSYQLHWSAPEDPTGVTITVLGVIAALMVWLLIDKEMDSRMKKRQEQLLIDYPEIIYKFTLLMNAGMTVKQAWNKIAEDYYLRNKQEMEIYQTESPVGKKLLSKRPIRKEHVRSKQVMKRYAYEEMLITVNELKLGQSEGIAYERFGRRIGLLPYIKFTSLITQNLKKGNKGFIELLKQEAMEAFENRKEIAKRLGEEAGTKLLAPMLLMLIIVFMIILVPAFISFQI